MQVTYGPASGRESWDIQGPMDNRRSVSFGDPVATPPRMSNLEGIAEVVWLSLESCSSCSLVKRQDWFSETKANHVARDARQLTA